MLINKLRLLLIFLQIFIVFAAHSKALQYELYQTTLPVESQRANERKEILPKALEQVLIKRSGNSDIAQQELIQQELNDAERWMTRYQYQRQPDQKLFLQVFFDPQAIDNLLAKAGQPLWEAQRPLTLVWLAIGDDEYYQLIGSLASSEIPALLHQAAEKRGIPILLPALDLTDMQLVSPNVIWQANAEPILQASQRYHAENILVGKVFQHSEQRWEGYWLMYWKNQWFSWNLSADSVAEIFSQVMEEISRSLATERTDRSTPSSSINLVTLRIEQINNLEDYEKVIDYLNRLSIVNTVEVTQLYPNALELGLVLNTTEAAFQQSLVSDARLIFINTRPDGILVYRYEH